MSRKRYSPEEVINKLREADVWIAKGQTVSQAFRRKGVTGLACMYGRYGTPRITEMLPLARPVYAV